MKKTRISYRIIPLVLILTVVLIPLLAMSASAATSSVDYTKYDISKSGSHNNVELGVVDFIEMIDSSIPVSEIERDYLLDYSYISVKYDQPTSAYVTVTAKDDEVTVSALPYTYTSVGKTAVTWYPISAKIEGGSTVVTLTKNGSEYIGVIDGVTVDESTTVQVEYKIDYKFVIGKDDMNGALNYAYNQAVSMKGEYNSIKDAYDAAKKEYDEYLKRQENIEEEVAKYEKYLDDYAIYLEDLAVYNKYLDDYAVYEEKAAKYAEYQKKLEEYNAYRAYVNNYASYLSQYESDLAKYNDYVKKMNKIDYQLNVLDTGLYDKVTDLQRQLYACIFGDTVDDVVANKDIIIAAAGKDCESAIDDAGLATTNIRNILTEYNKLETQADKYSFYIANYDSIKKNFILLAQTLFDLYR